MHFKPTFCLILCSGFFALSGFSQIFINEGSNKNFAAVTDEDGDHPDWIELYNAGNSPVNLDGYTLTDDSTIANQWSLPGIVLEPGAFKLIHCSGKDRYEAPPATMVINTGEFTPMTGWNQHAFDTPFYWDGISNLVINTCSYSSLGYITNSVFNGTYTDYNSVTFAYADGSPGACFSTIGGVSNFRPNMLINDIQIGFGTDQNCNTCYPAPYGNWYWGARNQMLIKADELIAAGLSAGEITSLSFDVAYTDPVLYDYIEIHCNTTYFDEMSETFIHQNGYRLHTNFALSGEGESVFLYDNNEELVSDLYINPAYQDISMGQYPDGADLTVLFQYPTPEASNNASEPADSYADMPEFSLYSGFYDVPLYVTMTNTNGPDAEIYYTLDGSDPDTSSILYDNEEVYIFQSSVLKARSYAPNKAASDTRVATYFINVDHATPILSVTIDNENLYGLSGIFDNPMTDWLKPAYAEYFDSTATHNLVMSQRTGMKMDGGWGGSRTQPQRSFRLELDNGSLGAESLLYPANPYRPYRNIFSDFYLRNGSNQYLTLPYKDAAQVRMMAGETHNYYSAWRPITVYINGQYFGLYELREKFNKEKFIFEDNATDSTIEILSVSAFYGGILRAVEGDPDHYIQDITSVFELNASSPNYPEQVDQYIDLKYYMDYVIGETWMGNVDWPWNNIKIYRSDATDYRWRFCLIDLELSMLPNSWTDCMSDNVEYVISQGQDQPFIGAFNRLMNNNLSFKNDYINRFADLMNTTYKSSRLLEIENTYFDQTVVEMPNEYQRWADPWNVNGWMNTFYNNHLIFQSQLECRSEQVRTHLQENYLLDEQVEVTLDVFPAGAGRIQINTVTPGEMPWSGIYFKGVPVNLTAIPNPGYFFDYWQSEILLTTPFGAEQIEINVTEDDHFTAYFQGVASPTTITISEINYNSEVTHPCEDWIEVHNYGNAMIDLTGYYVTNENNQPAFHFPEGFVLYSGQYVVLARNPDAFIAQYPDVTNYLGPLPFSLSPSGGTIRIYNHFDQLYLSFTYNDENPWPVIADGGGRTLELADPAASLNEPQNWFAGCMFGSPGVAFHPCDETILFSEINYNSSVTSDAGDWVELRNVGNATIDLSGWVFQDFDDENAFQLPESSQLNAGEMIVLCRDESQFTNIYPANANHIGNFIFGLDEGTEMLRLYDASGKLYLSMIYGSEDNWPQTPNGNGFTLELLDSTGNLNSADNWFAGCLLGSPGEYFSPCETTSVYDTAPNADIAIVFPNPASNKITVRTTYTTKGNSIVQVFDAFGNVVFPAEINMTSNGCNIDISNLSIGCYTFMLIDNERMYTGKFIRQ